MNILYYEFMDATESSNNGLLKKLVTQVRTYCNSPVDRIDELRPPLLALAQTLEKIDESMMQEPREYITEIMEALSKEAAVYNDFMDSLPFSCDAVFLALFDKKFNRDEYHFEYNNERGEHFVEFFGYRERKPARVEFQVIREVLRGHCYRYNIIFIDSSQY